MHQPNNAGPAAPFHPVLPVDGIAQAAARSLGAWHIHCRQGAANSIAGFDTSDAATEAACRLMDNGCEVIGIGLGPDEDTIDREHIALIYALWVRARYH